MKKYFVLSIILIFLLSNFAIASSSIKRYKKPSTGKMIINMILWGAVGAGIGHLVNEKEGWKYGATIGSLAVLARQSKLRIKTQILRERWSLVDIAEKYQLTERYQSTEKAREKVRIKVISAYDPSIKLEAEKVLFRFGFIVVEKDANLQIKIHKKDISRGQNSYYALGYTTYDTGVTNIILEITDNDGKKHYIDDTRRYEYMQQYSDGYAHSFRYQDPFLMAGKRALTFAVVNFIEKFDFEPYR